MSSFWSNVNSVVTAANQANINKKLSNRDIQNKIKEIMVREKLKLKSEHIYDLAKKIIKASSNNEVYNIDEEKLIKQIKTILSSRLSIKINENNKKNIDVNQNFEKLEKIVKENGIKNNLEFLNNHSQIIELEIQNINYEKLINKNKEDIEKFKKEQEYNILELRKDLITYIMENEEIVLFISNSKDEWISYFSKYNIFRFFTDFSDSEIYNVDRIFLKEGIKKVKLSQSLKSKFSPKYDGNTVFVDEKSYSIDSGYLKKDGSIKYCFGIENSFYNYRSEYSGFSISNEPLKYCEAISNFYSFEEYKNTENSYENAEQVLNLLIKYDFVPLFQTSKWSFDENLKQKYLKLKELYDTTQSIIELKTSDNNEIIKYKKERKFDYMFNYDLLLKNYYIDNTEHNLVDYYGNIKKWIDDLNNEVSQVTNAYKDVFSTINNYQTKQRNLNFIDNSAFEERKAIFERYLIGNPEEFYKTLFSIGEKAKEYELKVNEATNNFDFKLLTELEREERPSFSLIAKNTGEQWNDYAKQLSEVSNNLPRINRTIDIHEKEMKDWNLLIQRKENYLSKEDIDKNLLDSWFEEWSFEYIELSRKVNNLLESYLRDIVDENSFNFILEELYNFRKNLDKLYEEEVIGTHYKFAFVPGGDLQESLERKSLKFKFIIQSIDNIEKLIFSVENPITRRFLIKWNNMWFSNEILENINRFSSSDYDEVMIALNRDFIKMKEDNFKEFYNDVDAYINHKKEREKEYNSLIFKMRKEIAKQYANKQV